MSLSVDGQGDNVSIVLIGHADETADEVLRYLVESFRKSSAHQSDPALNLLY